jgi:hypothetical protein
VAPIVPMIELIAESVAAKMNVTDAERLVTDLYWYRPDRVIERVNVVGRGADRRATTPEPLRALLER